MITYFYKSLRSEKVEQTKGFRKGVWVHVEDPTRDELQELADTFKVDADLLHDATDEDEMPRLEHNGEFVYVYVRAPHVRKLGTFDTVPLLFIFAEDCLITVSEKSLECLHRFIDGDSEFATTQRTKLFLQMMHVIVNQYDDHITETGKQIKSIRARLRGHEISNKDFLDFVTIEDELNEFLSALQPNNATLRRLSIGKHIPLFQEDQNIVDDLLLSTDQSVEASHANIKSIVNIRQAYTAISSNNLNRTMKILTVATVLISLPNTIFGMYGMNIGLPFQNAVWAYMAVVSMVLVLLIAIYLIFKGKKVI